MSDRDLEAPWVGKTPEEYYGYKERKAFDCDSCGEAIYEGEEYYDFDGYKVCQECIDSYCRQHKTLAED